MYHNLTATWECALNNGLGRLGGPLELEGKEALGHGDGSICSANSDRRLAIIC